ncbi:Pleiotropic drug resistance protein [Phytophthora cinnamomi]|uniref:Pleiotropic drug resistance protein n=1 Tax=Phytophthora cinnamomi TaxID=4785 RepID=UPI003559CC1F|nr:Pleiotropic drug resistance protein [Phytophthora cinnamomi]
MVAPAGKTPRHQLSEQERRLCLEVLLSDRHARRIGRAQQKDSGDVNTTRRSRAAKLTTAEMEIAESKECATAVAIATSKAVADMQASAEAKETSGKKKKAAKKVGDVVITAAKKTTPTRGVAKKSDAKKVASALVSLHQHAQPHHPRLRKRRRSLLQDDEDDEIESSGDKSCDERSTAFSLPTGTVDSDPNLMNDGADRCTGLNSDEDSDLDEEPEEEEEADDEDWDGDWDIGSLTDEDSDVEPEELPDSVWASAAKDKQTMAWMRDSGWEYDTSKFGPDPTYKDLYDGLYGPSDSVLRVADNPLALLFYFLPPKLWVQIAVESNGYHQQTIPLRVRALRSQQRRNAGDVEDLAEIRRRLAAVDCIEAWEVLRVVALLIARMLVPTRKGIAAHWSLKKVGALPANRFGKFLPKNRFFHIMGLVSLHKDGKTAVGSWEGENNLSIAQFGKESAQ